MSTIQEIRSSLSSLKSPKKGAALQKHFKAGPGEYAAGDKFLGIDMANQRTIAKENFESIPLDDLSGLMKANIHEFRMTTLMMLNYKFAAAGSEEERSIVFDFYIDHLDYVNNWDLVDTTAEKILGVYLLKKDRSMLTEMAKSRRLWRERLALLASMHFVRNKDFSTSFELVGILAQHPHPIIHQATGKLFTEIIKRNADAAEDFLSKHYRKMSSGMLKSAVAGLGEDRQSAYKSGSVQPLKD